MKTRLIVAAVALPLLAVVILFLPPAVLAVMVSIITCGCAFELLRAVQRPEKRRIYVYPMAAAAVIPIGLFFGFGRRFFMLTAFLLLFAMFAEAVFGYQKRGAVSVLQILTALFGGLLVPFCLSVLVRLKLMPHGGLYVLLVFITTMVSDSGAYFAGVFLGKHRGVLAVSPNKSAEGFAGSLLSLIIGMQLYGLILRRVCGLEVNFLYLLVYSIPGNAATQLGDLAFSLIKREHGIKDYGQLIPGNGGMMDRFDSMVFAAPVIYMLLETIPAF